MQQFAQLGFPELYESVLVPTLFRPWAEDILHRIDLSVSDSIIDVACGTGIVARVARERTGARRIVGIDLNPAMLAVAQDRGPNIEWRIGDATALPVAEGETFSAAVCQQGLQFIPDRKAAIAEIRRVLSPGGHLAVSTWQSDENFPFLHGLRQVAEQHVGKVTDRRHSFGDAAELGVLLTEAGFRNVQVESVTKTMRFSDGNAFAYLNAAAMIGMSERGPEISPEERDPLIRAIVADCRELIVENTNADGFSYDIGANVATARS